MNKEFLSQIQSDEQPVAHKLLSLAEDIQVSPVFQTKLETQLREMHERTTNPARGWQTKILPSLGWAILIVGAVLLLNWALRSLAPEPVPAANGTPNLSRPTESNPAPVIEEASPTPTGIEYDWRGTQLYLDATLPDTPEQAGILLAQPDQHATLDSARALAAQFGMAGQVYETPPELGGSDKTDFLVVDGNQRLRVRSNLYFSYYPDYTRRSTGSVNGQIPDQATAEQVIDSFLRSRGFDFAYKVEFSEFYSGYYALPLTPDGFTIRHEHFKAAGMLFRFDETGIIAVEAGLVTYTHVGDFGIITAESALQKLLGQKTTNGIREGMHSVNADIKTWYRTRPENQTMTVWGWISSVKSIDGGNPLVTFDGYQATGNLAGLAESTPNTFIEATGQFRIVDGIKTFDVESWQVYDGFEDGLQGTIQRDGDLITITNIDGNVLTLPDIPNDLPLPLENAFVLGVTRGEVFEWKSIDTRMQAGGGGGGGGGGTGFYKLNLTGTPVPFPTPGSSKSANSETSEYVVQAGDTLSKIASDYGITIDELMQANGLNETAIFIGQTLVIPGTAEERSPVGQRIEGQRGIVLVNIYRKPDGSQRTEYGFVSTQADQYGYLQLKGPALAGLDQYNNRPVDIWGTIENVDDMGTLALNVERYEIPYPDLQFQILRGTQQVVNVQGQQVIVFTTEDGKSYVQLTSYGDPDAFGIIGNPGDAVLIEALLIPDETFGDYPTVRIHSMSMAINPKNGQAQEMQVTADQVNIIDEPQTTEDYTAPTATIEKVELAYFAEDARYAVPGATIEPSYIQPVWHFSGHYNNGDEFEILVQALKEEFLLPEVETIEPPG